MMERMKLVFLVVTSVSCFAADQVYLRSPSGPSCQISGATDATPIVITCAAPHGFSAGQALIIYHVRGNYAANGVRLVKNDGNLTSTTFAITDVNSTNIAGSGSFVSSVSGQTNIGPPQYPYAAPATLYNLNAHPRGWFNSALLASMQNAGAGGRSNPSAAGYVGLTNVYNANVGTYSNNLNPQTDGHNTSIEAVAAEKWYSDGASNSTAKTFAQFLMTNPDIITGQMTGCDETGSFCNYFADLLDYTPLFINNVLITYELLYSQMTSGQRQVVADYLLNDLDSNHMGLNAVGSACTKIAFKSGPGTVTVSGSTVTGVGTNFGTSIHVGDVIFVGAPSTSTMAVVSAIGGATSLTLNSNFSISGTASAWTYSPRWSDAAGDCGWVWLVKHHGGSILSDPVQYPTGGGQQYDVSNNSAMTFGAQYFQVGMSMCGQDTRGCLLASLASAYIYDQMTSMVTQDWGHGQSSDIYDRDRTYWIYNTFVTTINNSVVNGYDLRFNSLKDNLYEFIYHSLPYSTLTPAHYGEPGNSTFDSVGGIDALMAAMYNYPSDAPYANYWLLNTTGWLTSTTMGAFAGTYTPRMYLHYDPSLASTSTSGLSTQYIFHPRDQGRCATLGLNCSGFNSPNQDVISRTGMSASTDTLVQILAHSIGYFTVGTDGHDIYGCPGCLRLYRNVALMAGDHNGDPGSNIQTTNGGSGYASYDNIIEVGGTANFASNGGNCTTTTQLVATPRWASTNPTGDVSGRYMYVMVDATGAYCPSANVTRMQRHFAHFKKPGAQDYIVEFVDGALSSGNTITERLFYFLNGVPSGAAISASVGNNGGTVKNLQTSGGALLNSTILPITTNTAYATNDGSSYPYNHGAANRVSVCAENSGATGSCNSSATTANWFVIYQPINGTSGSMPALTQLTSTNFDTVQIADSTTPKVAAFAQGGSTYTSAGFTTTHSGTAQYLIAGLTAGSYNVSVGGSTVSGSPFVVNSGDNTLYFESTSGSVTITQVGGAGLSCDLNGDGVVNILDVQLSTAAYLGLVQCAAQYQLDGSGACTVVDVQRVATAALGLGCRVGP